MTIVRQAAIMMALTESLKELDLASNHIGGYYPPGEQALVPTTAGPRAIADAVRSLKSLTSIDIGDNDLDQESTLELLGAMKGKRMVSIRGSHCACILLLACVQCTN